MRKQPDAPPDIPTFAHQLAAGIADLREFLGPLDDAVRGYREELRRDGWSETASEQMAVGLHAYLLNQIGASAHG